MDNHKITNRWILASIGGLFLGSIVQIVVANTIGPVLLPEKPVMALLPLDLSLGLTMGTLQALVLRRYFTNAWIWAVATGVGIAAAEVVSGFVLHDLVGFEFGFYRSPLPDALVALAIVGVLIGLCVGSAQWLVLFQAGYHSLLWIPVTIVGFTTAIAAGDILAIPEMLHLSLFGLLAGFVSGGALYGLTTGLWLKRLILSQPAPED